MVPLAEGVAPEELPELLKPSVLLAAPELLEPVVETTRVLAPLELLEVEELEPPQAARAAVRVRMAMPWPSNRQFLPVRMSHHFAIRWNP